MARVRRRRRPGPLPWTLTTARPWRTFGRWLAARDLAGPAEAAYTHAAESKSAFPWTSVAVRPRLLADAGRTEETEAALRKAHLLSWDVDPWLLLEAAWRELPAPRADAIELAGLDYGAVRGFHHPRGIDPTLIGHRREITLYRAKDGPVPPPGPHRWTRATAFLRLRPTVSAPVYRVTLVMGSPFPLPSRTPKWWSPWAIGRSASSSAVSSGHIRSRARPTREVYCWCNSTRRRGAARASQPGRACAWTPCAPSRCRRPERNAARPACDPNALRPRLVAAATRCAVSSGFCRTGTWPASSIGRARDS